MAFEITGHKAGLEGAFVRTQAHTAADALRFANGRSRELPAVYELERLVGQGRAQAG
jgi:hypothetical protein